MGPTPGTIRTLGLSLPSPLRGRSLPDGTIVVFSKILTHNELSIKPGNSIPGSIRKVLIRKGFLKTLECDCIDIMRAESSRRSGRELFSGQVCRKTNSRSAFRPPSQGPASSRAESNAPAHNERSPADIVSRASEKRQRPTLPPGGAVPSALVSLTSLFGMVRGGSSPL